MSFDSLNAFIAPILLLSVGIMLRYSNYLGWGQRKKLGLFFIIIGLFNLAYTIYKHL
jgi:hypothetical protein